MRSGWRLGVLVLALGAASTRLPQPPASVTEASIGTALVSARGADRTARATEPVRYEDAAVTMLGSFVVRDGRLPSDAGDARADRVWAIVRSTLPDDGVDRVRQLNVVTDGHDGTLAMVHRSAVDSSFWVLSIDPAEDDDVLVSTLVHEYGHMLTLRSEDLLSVSAARSGCPGRTVELGCALTGSALADWHDRFWADAAPPAAADLVSEYAGTSSHEDLAESFMTWVLGGIDRPTAGVQDRFDFFDERPEFLAARDAVLAKLRG